MILCSCGIVAEFVTDGNDAVRFTESLIFCRSVVCLLKGVVSCNFLNIKQK